MSGPQQGYVQGLITSLKAANVWSSLDRLWLFAAENATQALIDLKARATATAVNSPTFTANRGYAGNGTTSYLNSNYNPTTLGSKYLRDNASMATWVETAPAANGGIEIGTDNSAYSRIVTKSGATQRQFQVNSGTTATVPPATAVFTGWFHAQRTAPAVSTLFRNGVAEFGSIEPSIALQNKNAGILAGPISAPNFAGFSTARVAASLFGSSLAGKEVALYTAMRTYMTSVGVA